MLNKKGKMKTPYFCFAKLVRGIFFKRSRTRIPFSLALSNSYALLGNASVESNLTNGEPSTVLCFVVKHAGSGQSTREVGRNTRRRQVFLPTS